MPVPVPAIPEVEATGEIRAIYADIRETLGVPVVNLIWRHLATIEGGLDWAWRTAKPIYASGAARSAAGRLRQALDPPLPAPLPDGALGLLGLDREQVRTARAVVDAYDRGNTLNLVALTALTVAPSGHPPLVDTASGREAEGRSVGLPAVLSEADVSPEAWRLVLALNRLGARPDEPVLATLYRHLAHWPALLVLIHAGFAPLDRSAALRQSIARAREIARQEAADLATLAGTVAPRHQAGCAAVAEFADHVICRMVPIGMALGRWLDGAGPSRR